ncbi:MAG: hypothetical protein JNK56_01475 [Myxococcales bacterium]|nr:hypothetical protein [Myxococcales bacterium]
MRIDVLYLSILLAGCRTSIEGTGEIVDLGATETTFGTVATTQSPTATAESGAEPGIPTTSGGETGGGTGSGASSGAAPVCGDGVIEGDESCDDGIEANKNFNPCRADCQPATCGDGFVQVSNSETCDDGPLNTATPGYNECSTACVRATYCGDGIVQAEAGEECEPGGDDDADTCAAMCRHKPRLVFLTSAVYSGNLGGLAGADKRCNEFAAQQPGLTGSYRAWLLVDGQSLADRFPEFVAPATWNFTNTSAGLLAKSFTELIEEGPAEPVAFTEAGDAVPEALVWTGILKDGIAAGGDCAQWTSEAGSPALVGFSGYVPDLGPDALHWQLERQWTDKGLKRLCGEKHPIYCVQVAD